MSVIHAERVVAFPLQQWLPKRATILHFTYIAYLVVFRLYYIEMLSVLDLLT